MRAEDESLRFVGQRIKELRRERGWSQEALAELIGEIQQSQVSEWERGKTIPETLSLFRVIRALGVTPSYFFGNGGIGPATERLIAAGYMKQYAEQLEAEAATLSEAEDGEPPSVQPGDPGRDGRRKEGDKSA